MIIKIFYTVHNRCGYGFLEEVYENGVATDSEGGRVLHCGPEWRIKWKVFDTFRKIDLCVSVQICVLLFCFRRNWNFHPVLLV